MNITSLNSFNYMAFGAKKTPRRGKFESEKQVSKPRKTEQETEQLKKRLIAAGAAGVLTASGLYGMVQVNQSKNYDDYTIPTTSIVETQETETVETQPVEIIENEWLPIPVKPQEERKREKEILVEEGQGLVKIIKANNSNLANAEYEEIIPYIERLMVENPYLIKRVNREGGLPEYTLIYNPKQENYLKIDAIFPDNIIGFGVEIEGEDEETLPTEETIPEPTQITSPDDTIIINGYEFYFDEGTLEKPFMGDWQGTMYGDFAVLDKKANGNTILTQHEDETAESDIASVTTRNKNGDVVKIEEYEDGEIQTVKTYEYGAITTVETQVNKTAKGNEVDEIVTEYDKNDESKVYSREYFVNGKPVIAFDFETGEVAVGKDGTIIPDLYKWLAY